MFYGAQAKLQQSPASKGSLLRLVSGPSFLMAIPTLHSSRQWAISKKPAISLPVTPSIYFNTQQDPWCGKIRFLGLFNICFWQLQCVRFSLQKAAGELSRHFIFFLRPNKIHNGFWEIICDFTQKKKELKERLSPSPHKRLSPMLAWGQRVTFEKMWRHNLHLSEITSVICLESWGCS